MLTQLCWYMLVLVLSISIDDGGVHFGMGIAIILVLVLSFDGVNTSDVGRVITLGSVSTNRCR